MLRGSDIIWFTDDSRWTRHALAAREGGNPRFLGVDFATEEP